ncbi:MAG: hypothetical protein ACD_56C00107G0003 [uncultured bacterium]|nr:MAG: hypothetical protein ACD_56C00107G0003 [uncultured bacterium]
MYWVYLVMFTFIVFVPTLIKQGFWILDATAAQELAILVLGSIGFVIFLIMEKSLGRHIAEKSLYQKQVNRMSKDLTKSYSYIGEINRKLDILENIALGYPESSELAPENQSDVYESIMGAVQVFGKSDDFSLCFMRKSDLSVVQEIKSLPESSFDYSAISCEENKCYTETEGYIIIASPKTVEDIFSCILIRKKQVTHSIEDREMMKTLASQALFIFMFLRQKKQIKCVL